MRKKHDACDTLHGIDSKNMFYQTLNEKEKIYILRSLGELSGKWSHRRRGKTCSSMRLPLTGWLDPYFLSSHEWRSAIISHFRLYLRPLLTEFCNPLLFIPLFSVVTPFFSYIYVWEGIWSSKIAYLTKCIIIIIIISYCWWLILLKKLETIVNDWE